MTTPAFPPTTQKDDDILRHSVSFIACGTSGPDPEHHELLEISVVLASAHTFAFSQEATFQIVPKHLANADPKALAACGYDPQDWLDATPLGEALEELTPWLESRALAGHRILLDSSFLRTAYRKTGVCPPRLPRHLLDTATFGWPLLTHGVVRSLSLDDLAAFAQVPRRTTHPTNDDSYCSRTLDDARCAREVSAHLLRGAEVAAVVGALPVDHQVIAKSYVLRHCPRLGQGYRPSGEYDHFASVLTDLLDAMQRVGGEVSRTLYHRPDAQPTGRRRPPKTPR
jgi:DNA polymerase III epsilon subunit-like protein